MDADEPVYVCLAGVDWWYKSHAHSEVQLLTRVARSRRVVFVNSIGLRMPVPGRTSQPLRRIVQKADSVRRFVRRPLPDVPEFVVVSPLSLPFYGSPLGRSVNRLLVRWQLQVVLRALGIHRPIYFVTLPTGYEAIRGLPRRALLVNKADKYSTLPDVDQAYIAGLERELLETADRVLYVSRAMQAGDQELVGDRASFLDHGVDLDHFTRRPEDEVPDDLARIPRPRVGYFGYLADYRVDFDLLERLARELPEVQLVLVGDASCSMERFDTLPNVHWLGSRSYEEIPAYGSGFDVGLMPYLRNEWIHHSNPIKLKEYLALGLPIVSTEVPEVARYTEWLSMASDPDDFIELVRQALAGHGPATPEGRRAAVTPYSWDGRAAAVVRIAESTGPGQPPGDEPEVTVVVVTYNNVDDIDRCLRSITDQLPPDGSELIVFDNASGDGTADLVARLWPAVTLVRSTENLGFARACNRAAATTGARFVLLVNPDATLEPGCLDALLDLANRHPEGGLYGGRTVRPDGTFDPRSCWGRPSVWSLFCFATGLSTVLAGSERFNPEAIGSWARDRERSVDVVSGCLLLARRDLWKRLGGFDEAFFMYGEDTDLGVRAAELGFSPMITPAAQMVHKVGGSSPDGSKELLLFRGKAALVCALWSGPTRSVARGLLLAGIWVRARLGPALRGVLRGTGGTDHQVGQEVWPMLWARRQEWSRGWEDVRRAPGAAERDQP
ncbi:MAG TPA: glycosyltransferase [Acidimicrobiales bacterium]